MRLEAYGRSDVGRVRPDNEDSLAIHWHGADGEASRTVGILAIADGVGGRAAGEVASRLFCERMVAHLVQAGEFDQYRIELDREMRQTLIDRLDAIASQVASDIYETAQKDEKLKGMATTGIVAVAVDQGLFLAHVGDSRAYLLRGDRIFRLTEDHSVVHMLVRSGILDKESAAQHPMGNRLAQAYGQAPHVEPDTLYLGLETGDRIVMCTDGVHRYLGGREIQALAEKNAGAQNLAEALVAAGNEMGGQDNLSAVVLDVQADGPETRSRRRIGLGTRIQYLNDLFLFGDLNDQELLRILRVFHQISAPAGQHLIREGDTDDAFFVVLDGSAVVSKGGEVLTAVAPGGHFGEFALIDETHRSADVVAQTDMVLMTCCRDDLMALLRQDPVLGNKLLMNFLRYITRRMRELTEDFHAVSASRRKEG